MWDVFDEFIKIEKEECGCNHNFIIDEGVYICTKCFKIENSVMISNEYNNPVSVKYKRTTHLRSTLHRLLGRETFYLPNEIVEIVRNYKPKNINQVRKVLKKEKLPKYYKHLYSIANAVGMPLPSLSQLEFDKIIYLFVRFDGIYKKISTKSNQLNYHFLLKKFFLIIDRIDIIPYLQKLKSKSKINEHEEIFQKCLELM